MADFSSKLDHIKGWRRAPALAGLVALVVLHVAAAIHQVHHFDDDSQSICHACSAYSQVEHSVSPDAATIKIPFAPVYDELLARVDIPPHAITAEFHSRGPPLS